ncbi:serine/threonine-protein kinase STE20 [Pelomyxa schiedti]|nr:serine/threonine-protein kinase STE20 [Pelomyxa schiedti]
MGACIHRGVSTIHPASTSASAACAHPLPIIAAPTNPPHECLPAMRPGTPPSRHDSQVVAVGSPAAAPQYRSNLTPPPRPRPTMVASAPPTMSASPSWPHGAAPTSYVSPSVSTTTTASDDRHYLGVNAASQPQSQSQSPTQTRSRSQSQSTQQQQHPQKGGHPSNGGDSTERGRLANAVQSRSDPTLLSHRALPHCNLDRHNRQRVVIVGGGFGGAFVAKELAKNFMALDVVLIDTKEYFENTSAIFKTFTDPVETPPQCLQVKHAAHLQYAEFVHGEVVDADSQSVWVNIDMQTQIRIMYDFLVIATGVTYPIVKEKGETQEFRAEWMLNEAKKIEKASSVIIVGGGATGIEFAANMASKWRGLNVKIIEHHLLLPRYPPLVRDYVTQNLQSVGVTVLCGHHVESINAIPNGNGFYVITDKSHRLEADLVFMCTGGIPNSGFMERNFPQCLTTTGHLMVNNHLQLENFSHIFVLGDVCNIDEEKMAERAMDQATVVAKNIKRLSRQRPPISTYHPYKSPMMVLSLGPNCAIAFAGGHPIAGGAVAATMKRYMDMITHKLFPERAIFQLPIQPKLKNRHARPMVDGHPVDSNLRSDPLFCIGLVNFTESRVGVKVTKRLIQLRVPLRLSMHSMAIKDVAKVLSNQSSDLVDLLTYDSALPDQIRTSVKGIKVMIYVLRSDNEDKALEEMALFLQYAKSGGVSHIIYIREHCTNTHNYCRLTLRGEDMVSNSTIPFTIVRHDKEFNNQLLLQSKPQVLLQRCLMLPIESERISWLDINDIADAVVNIALKPDLHSGQVNIAKILSNVLQEQVRYLPIQPEISEAKMVSSQRPRADCEMFLCTQRKTSQLNNLQQLIGREPSTFLSWVTSKVGLLNEHSENQQLCGRDIELLLKNPLRGNESYMEIDAREIILGEQVGSAAHGTVYKALFQNTPTALKVFNTSAYEKQLDFFRKGASLACLLRHPNLIVAMGACTHLPTLCIVYEWMPRGSLETLLSQDTTPLSLSVQVRMALCIAKGLAFLHSVGVVHQEYFLLILSSNLLLTQGMQVKIADYGTALPVRYRKGKLSGSPQYIAPEVLTGSKPSTSSDVYSFGIVLWQIATRKSPWNGCNNPFVVIETVVSGKRLPLDKEQPLYPLIMSCWDQQAQNRPTAHQAQMVLERMKVPSTSRPTYTTPTNADRPDLMNKLLFREADTTTQSHL